MNDAKIVIEPCPIPRLNRKKHSVATPAPTPATPARAVDAGLADVEKNWNEFGKRDPLWAILTADAKRDNKWDLAEFFATGEREIGNVVKHFDALNHTFGRGKALDFGCGVGRLTQALCKYFDECHGVDIAESMVEQARKYNRFGERCIYHVNTKPDLSLFADNTFDFVYTNIVLQHNPPAMARKFIQEFLRILKPGGLLEFQLPSEPIQHTSGEGQAMKPEAFKAELRAAGLDSEWLAGTAKKILVTVKNASTATWPGKAVSGKMAVRLGNHWRDDKDRVIINDDARADLPNDLKPGEEVTLPLSVSIPGAPGRYRLELDMVQEHVTWFAQKKSRTLTLDLNVVANGSAKTPAKPDVMKELDAFFATKTDVKAAAEAAKAQTQVLVPKMDMNGIPKPQMLAFLTGNGAKILRVTDDTGATGWLGFRYQVTKGMGSAECGVRNGENTTSNATPVCNSTSEIFAPRVAFKGSHQFAEDLLLSLKGRIAIVGNATPSQNFGEIIDAHDVVIRLNNFRTKGFEKLVGSKTDLRCTSGWADIEHRNEQVELSPFTAGAAESGNLEAFNRANGRNVLPACFDVHSLIAETAKPSTGFTLIQLCSYLEIPVDLFGFDGFKTAHYWEKGETVYTTHSQGEMDFILKRPGVVLFGETYPYQALYDFCHSQHHDYDENVGLELVRRLNKQFRGLKMLEFGAGNGDLTRHLLQQSNQVTAVEASRHAFDRIQCANKIHGTALSLPFINESFDTFISVDVLEHLTENDCRIVIREAARLCKNVFVSVCMRPSGLLGPKGENLHLTVRPASWWAKEFGKYFNVDTYPGYGNGQLVIEGARREMAVDLTNTTTTITNAAGDKKKVDKSESSHDSDEFYVNLFIKDPVWSTAHPNEDEVARWEKISTFIRAIRSKQPADFRLRILDVGCGRGWLTNMASSFGDAEGVEPVAPVVEQARKLFPNLKFTAGTADTILESPDFQPYDLVLTSEVIEHVPREEQPAFARKLSRLLKPGGVVILTTPRGEALQEWTRLAGDPSQPVEDWICEPELRDLFVNEQFIVAAQERVLFETKTRRYITEGQSVRGGELLPIYQVWAFVKPADQPTADAPSGEPRREISTKRESGYSFCIITNGKRPKKLQEEIASIRALNIPTYEILVGGEPPEGLEGVTLVPVPDAARNGRLGEMRNRLMERARYDHLVMADDDLIFKDDFYSGLRQYGDDYEVLCVRFLNADGTRYWDWATVGGPRGHSLLDYSETDPNVYVTGGLCIMKASVGTRVQWDEVRGFYQSEDVDFSRRLHAAGISIQFNRFSTVVHTDTRYTQVGSVILAADGLRAAVLGKIRDGKLDDARGLHAQLRKLDPAVAAETERETHPVLANVMKQSALTLPVRWRGPIFNPSGYASEAINYLLPLSECVKVLGIHHQNNNYSEKFVNGLKLAERGKLFELRDKYDGIKGGIVIEHNPANGFTLVPDAVYRIGRTMFETDRIAANWVTQCNQMDEIWVPSKFNVETFAKSGVLRDKLFVMPESVDEDEFNPEKHQALELPNRAAFNFLAIFEWSRRKGWDVLLSAYLREFSAADDVCLYLRTYLFSKPDGDPTVVIRRLIDEHAATLNLGDKKLPRIHIIAEQVPQEKLPALYKAADCLVAPSRGEGWGRPHHEAMMMGLPVIATNWSGNTEFMTAENSYLIEYTLGDTIMLDAELQHYRDQRWANPSEQSLREAMRRVQQNPAEGRAKGAIARQDMLRNFSRAAVTELLVARLEAIERKLKTPVCPAVTAHVNEVAPAQNQKRFKITWEGSFLDLGSLSHVNRELTQALGKETRHEITRVGNNALPVELANHNDFKNLSRRVQIEAPRQADVTVRHAWPPKWERPASGAWVLIQPWEFGVLPEEWTKRLANVDEIWAPTDYVRRVYVESGIHPNKVKIVPNGVDETKFRPGLEPLKLATQKKFRFLFVGGTIHRKGPDVLLKAYLENFTAEDDVCLVIKDFGGKSVYRGQTMEEAIAAAQLTPNAPEILYVTDELSPEDMPRLYAACQCLVHPYRGEGFGLPVLEAMACGLAVVVTGGGATDDFATDEFAYRVPALRTLIGEQIGGMKLHHAGWWLEPDGAAFAAKLKWIFANQDAARKTGLAASEHVRTHWTWENAARIAEQRLQDLVVRKREQTEAIAKRRARKAGPIALPAAAKVGYLGEARELLEKKNFIAARNAALAALNARPFHCEAYLLLAEIAKVAGDIEQAKVCAERARRMVPDWKPAKQFLKGLVGAGRSQEWPALPAESQSRLSVCLIARNEEKFLAKCLRSVREIAAQIVVVDTGSTDKTMEIAKQCGAEVHHFKWCDDFSAARNEALKYVTGDWVLQLDADEELLPEHIETLRAEMREASVMAYRLPIVDAGLEQNGCSYVPRLFRNAPGLFYVGRVHEQVFSSIEVRAQEWGLKNTHGKAVLFHHGYTKEMVASRDKIVRNLRLLELAIEEMPNEPNLLMNYGLELVRSGQLEAGLEQSLEALHIMSHLPASQVVPELRETLLTQISTHLMAGKAFAEIVKLWQSPLAKASPTTASQHFILGLAHMELKQAAEAAEQMRQCVKKRKQPTLTPINGEILKAGPNHCLAISLLTLGQKDAAAQAFRAALMDEPTSRPARFDFAKFLAQEQPLEALKLLHSLVADKPNETTVWQLGGEIALGRPEFLQFAQDWTGEAIKHCRDNAAIALQRAEALLLGQNPRAALPLWLRAHSAKSARHLAALTICEVLVGGCTREFRGGEEKLVSQEFLKWYRQLMKCGANSVIHQINEKLDELRGGLPSAAGALDAAMKKAEAAVA